MPRTILIENSESIECLHMYHDLYALKSVIQSMDQDKELCDELNVDDSMISEAKKEFEDLQNDYSNWWRCMATKYGFREEQVLGIEFSSCLLTCDDTQ